MAELKDKLDNIRKRNKELNPIAIKTQESLNKFTSIKVKDAIKLKEELNQLNISRLKDRHIIKIIDIMPENIDALKLIFVGENVTLKQDDLDKILSKLK